MLLRLLLASSLFCASCSVWSIDLGVVGNVYPITETDLIDEIQTILKAKEKSGELAKIQEEAKRRNVERMNNPLPVDGLSRTIAARTFFYDPTFHYPQSVLDERGAVIVPVGTKYNPLDVITLSQQLVFFDARDKEQVKFAKQLIDKHGTAIKPILVAGSFLDLMRTWQIKVYYDQKGLLVKRFGIAQVPALVTQEGKALRIDEVLL
jgi:conjugal transfer pilus assembly protein TraW